jgi:hypothetical protein
MRRVLIWTQVLSAISICWAQSPNPQARSEAEYYVTAYAEHYKVQQVKASARRCDREHPPRIWRKIAHEKKICSDSRNRAR